MKKILLTYTNLYPTFITVTAKKLCSEATERTIAECCMVLNIPLNSKQVVVRQALLELATRFHPDSRAPEADMDKFVAVENAFRALTKYNTGVNDKEDVEKIVYDIRVLINNGFTPEWITLAKEIDEETKQLKKEIQSDRMSLGPHPLAEDEAEKWQRIYESNKELASSINIKIKKYNLIVPLLNKQKFHVDFDKICEDILKNSLYSTQLEKEKTNVVKSNEYNNNGVGNAKLKQMAVS